MFLIIFLGAILATISGLWIIFWIVTYNLLKKDFKEFYEIYPMFCSKLFLSFFLGTTLISFLWLGMALYIG